MSDSHSNLVEHYHDRWCSPELRGRIALRSRVREISYSDLAGTVGRIAGGLNTAGVRRGDLVGLGMERSLDLALALLGVMVAGACPYVVEPRLGKDEVHRRMKVAGIRWFVQSVADEDYFRPIDGAAFRVLYFQNTLNGMPYWDDDVRPEDPGLLLFTTGSTGKPKGVLLNHGGLKNNSDGIVAHTKLGPSDCLLHIMPLYHTNGINNQLLAPLSVGACVALAPRFRAQDVPELMKEFHPSIITGVPTIFSRILQQEVHAIDIKSLRFVRCGSAPITRDLHHRIEEFWNREVLVSYGLSEATCTSTMNPPGQRRIGSVGTQLKGQNVILRDSDSSYHKQAGQEGEICIEGGSLMTGYVGVGTSMDDSPIQNQVLATGDVGLFDRDGYLYVTGRLKEVIIRGGENISPALLENIIVNQSAVMECCVVGMPDRDLGEVPVAFVVPTPGHQIDEKLLQAVVKGELGNPYRLARVVTIPDLPVNGVGKVDRKALVARLTTI